MDSAADDIDFNGDASDEALVCAQCQDEVLEAQEFSCEFCGWGPLCSECFEPDDHECGENSRPT
jgi:hypothetical protein